MVRKTAPVALVVAAAAVLCFWDLGGTPVYLGGDEAQFGIHAHAIATTGRDLDGRLLPLFVNLRDPLGDQNTASRHRWYQPMLFYLIAIGLKVLPFGEASVRAPVAFFGLLDAVLIYVVARRIFGRPAYAVAAAVMLVASPAHLIMSRQATDYILPLPFVLGWLFCVLVSLESGSVLLSFAAGLLLGIGCYSYLAAWVLMPLGLVLTWTVQAATRRPAARQALATALGFALPVAVLVPWLWTHPDMWRETASRYGLAAADRPAYRALSSLRFGALSTMVSVYWDYFDPAYLFLNGGSSLTTTTGKAGVFLLSFGALIPLGVYALLNGQRSWRVVALLLAGFAIAPIPATLAGERYMAQRATVALPFGVLIAVGGLVFLVERWSFRPARAAAIALVALMAVQFTYVCRLYFTDYRSRAAFFYDHADFRDAAEYLVAADISGHVPAIYLSRQLDEASARWRFYLTKAGQLSLLERTRYFDGDGLDLSDVAVDSLAAFDANPHTLVPLLRTGQWSLAWRIIDNDGDEASIILRKMR